MVPVMLGGYLGASVEVGGANARNAASRLWSAEIHLRFPVAHDPVMIHKFHLPFHAITSHKLVVTSYADGSGGPHALRTSPLASELLLTCAALPLAGAASPLTCPPAAANPFNARVAGYARGGFAHYVRLRHYRSSLLAKGK